MFIPTTVTFKGLPPSDALRQSAISHAQQLSLFANDIGDCEVTFRSDTLRRHQPNRFCVQVTVSMQGERIGAGCGDLPGSEEERGHALLSRSFETLARRIESFLRRRRGNIQAMPIYRRFS